MLMPPMLCNDGDGDDNKGENGVVIGDENDDNIDHDNNVDNQGR